jgi:asparagine synthase (glutamine-hydrolysing)
MSAIIVALNKNDEDATETAVAMLKTLDHKGTETFGVASPKIVKIEKTIEELQRQNMNSPVIIGHTLSRILSTDKPQPLKLSDGTLVFAGRIYPTTSEISDVEVLVQKLDRKEAIENLFESDGCFAFAVAKSDKIITGRDIMGVNPFYYGENLEFAALASERKVLWKIGIKNANSFPPGHVALVDKDGFQFKRVKTLRYSKEKQTTMQTAAKHLLKLLQQSVKERLSGLRDVAVAFSGGLDSSLIAFLAKNAGLDVHLIYASLKNQSETEHAKKVAEEMKLPIHVYVYDEEDVQNVLSQVLWLIEEPDSVKTSIGVPFYWIAERAAQKGLRVMLAGQGADELFGGYKRYVNDYSRYGGERVHKILFSDVRKMYETNFERDFKICNFHNVELRLPFAGYKIAKFAIGLPVTLKVKLPDDGLRKLVLRQAAKYLGLPQFIVERPKRAIQYATGVNKVLKKLANKKGLPLNEYLHRIFQVLLQRMKEND